mmetsp:Transcript_16027/g.37803  ORF Transcript_16027/g.37803 Transcript_16027/m.37803 type:complete len:218 (+) Transcript_16027:65-718(+)
MFACSCSPCAAQKAAATDTIKVSMDNIQEEADASDEQQLKQQEHARQESLLEEERARAEAERSARAAEEEAARVQAEEEDRRRRELAEVQAKQEAEEEEARQRERDELDRQRRELEMAQQQRKDAEDAERLNAFLALKGYTGGPNCQRKQLRKFYYPLHDAVASNNPDIVRLLLRARADPGLKSSSGKLPLDRARKLNKDGSYTAVVQVLQADDTVH